MKDKFSYRQASCTGKVAHPTLENALVALHKLKDKIREEGAVPYVRAYKCQFCGKHHIGNSMKSRLNSWDRKMELFKLIEVKNG